MKPVAKKQMAYPDADVGGLEFRVSGDGRKTWSFRYRTRGGGRQGRVTLGVFSDIFDLDMARREARKARVIVDDGGDPAEVFREEKQKARSEPLRTFDDLAQAYFTATEKGRYRPSGSVKRASSLKNEKAVYDLHIKPTFGKVRPETITRAMVKSALEDMLDRGVKSQANKAQAIIRQMLTFAVDDRLRLPMNPLVGMAPVAPENKRARIYTDAELRAIWAGILNPAALHIPEAKAAVRRDGDKVFVGAAMRILIQLAAVLLQRRTEVAGMMVSEVDLENGVWIIPEERMKTRRPHAVPLSPFAVGLIKEALALTEGRDRSNNAFVFQSRAKPDQPINGPSVNNALGNVLLALGIENGTVHDLRRTGSTVMTSERLNVSPFIRSKVLGHVDNGGGSSVSTLHYDANSYLAEKRRALEAWEELLLKIVEPKDAPSEGAA